MDCGAIITDRIRQSGPITVADYMALALYAPGAGYYARAVQRSGRAGDFVTSVDVGPLFGLLLASRVVSMFAALDRTAREAAPRPLDLVESAAGNGRLARDMLDGFRARVPDVYERLRVTLVDRSAVARDAQTATLAAHHDRLAASTADLPRGIHGVLFCNELLDALPVHVVEMTAGGLAEVHVALDGDRLVERLLPPSTPRLAAYFGRLGLTLTPGARAEVHLAALDWVRDAAASLERGYLLIIDYGHEAPQLYAPGAPPTLRSFTRHVVDAGHDAGDGTPPWLIAPGTRDLTTHVDLTSVRLEAERHGLQTLVRCDQSRFLLDAAVESGLLAALEAPDRLQDRLALKALLVPGGMGTTHQVLLFVKDAPALSIER